MVTVTYHVRDSGAMGVASAHLDFSGHDIAECSRKYHAMNEKAGYRWELISCTVRGHRN